eukprot:7389176-Prymnesium_polylepis.1
MSRQMSVRRTATLTAEQFDVDESYPCRDEFLQVNNERFCGSSFATGMVVQSGSTIEWRSDDVINALKA